MKNVEKFEDAIPRVNGIYYKLHLAKQAIGKINKSADNPFFKSKYADLNTILDVVEPILHKYNLLLLQPIANGCVQSIVIDVETGEEYISEIKLPEINDPQKLGGCISYFRRYSVQSLLSLSMQDDDANDVTKHVNKKPTMPQERFENGLTKVDSGEITKEQFLKPLSQFELTEVQKAVISLL
jgi:hypothetical protein